MQGANYEFFDPIAMPNAKKTLQNNSRIYWSTNEMDAATGADAVAPYD